MDLGMAVLLAIDHRPAVTLPPWGTREWTRRRRLRLCSRSCPTHSTSSRGAAPSVLAEVDRKLVMRRTEPTHEQSVGADDAL